MIGKNSREVHSVNRVQLEELNTSLGTKSRVRQGKPDRNQATVSDINLREEDISKIGTWNVRTLYQPGKLSNVILEMKRLRINILGVCETRWKGSGKFREGKHTIMYSEAKSMREGLR